jgi:hypothetical protein
MNEKKNQKIALNFPPKGGKYASPGQMERHHGILSQM